MRHAVARDIGAMLRFREHEGALQHRLRMERQALGTPCRLGRVERFRRFYVLGNPRRVRADISLAGATDRGMRVVSLLHHGAEEAGELGDRPRGDRAPEIDVAEQAIQKIAEWPDYRHLQQPEEDKQDIRPGYVCNSSLNAGVSLDHFYSYMPMHRYIFTPTRELWPRHDHSTSRDLR